MYRLRPVMPFTTTNALYLLFVTVTIVLLHVAGRLVHRRLVKRLTVLDDLPDLGKPVRPKVEGCAVICGGR